MPTFQTDISTGQAAAAASFATGRIDDSRRVDGPLETLDSIYTIANPTTEATSDLIYIGDLPLGAIVYPEESFFYTETDIGTLLTLDVGDTVDPDRYADGSDVSAVGKVEFTTAVKNVDGVVNRHEVTETTRALYATIVGTVTSLTAGAKLHFKVKYKCLGT